ncbi:hypothetical protein FEDK69T_03240 [Flavobacterium enshiense DK69]|nr:hypothetical protein FEDK69T_03240 [Flavobacterium enshiense DK69]
MIPFMKPESFDLFTNPLNKVGRATDTDFDTPPSDSPRIPLA